MPDQPTPQDFDAAHAALTVATMAAADAASMAYVTSLGADLMHGRLPVTIDLDGATWHAVTGVTADDLRAAVAVMAQAAQLPGRPCSWLALDDDDAHERGLGRFALDTLVPDLAGGLGCIVSTVGGGPVDGGVMAVRDGASPSPDVSDLAWAQQVQATIANLIGLLYDA